MIPHLTDPDKVRFKALVIHHHLDNKKNLLLQVQQVAHILAFTVSIKLLYLT